MPFLKTKVYAVTLFPFVGQLVYKENSSASWGGKNPSVMTWNIFSGIQNLIKRTKLSVEAELADNSS